MLLCTAQATKGAGHETEAQRLASQEAARQLDEQLAVARARMVQLESVVKAKDRELERLGKQLETARSSEQQLISQKVQVSG